MSYEELPSWQLKIGYWFTKNRVHIRAALFSLAFFLLGALLMVNAKQLFDFFALDEIGAIQSSLVDDDWWQRFDWAAYRIQPLQFDEVTVVEQPKGTYNFVVRAKNPNAKVGVQSIAYRFVGLGFATDVAYDYILPGQERYLTAVNYQKGAGGSIADARMVVEEVKWLRVRDPRFFMSGTFIPLELYAGKARIRTQRNQFVELSFELANRSVYNYAAVDAQAFLYHGGQMVGVGVLKVEDVRSGKTYPIRMRWFDPFLNASDVRIELSSNIVSSGALLPFETEQFE